jgi:hypothetical protein
MFLNESSFEQHVSSFMAGVYGWMSFALAITASAAYYIASNPSLFMYIQQPVVMMILFFSQLAFVFGLLFFLNRLSYGSALFLFLLYSFSLGITLSSIFYVYTEISIISAFLSTALMFGVMSVYGYITKTDLTSIGSLACMVVIGLVIGMIVNMFLHSQQLDYVISAIGVIIFVILTAYDTQKMKQLARGFSGNNEALGKATVFGALTLYLDFINLFLFLLRLVGKRNEE